MFMINAFVVNVLPFLVVLSVLVFVHELGHYLVARRNGVQIEVFSIGFGPEIFGWNDRAGTRWKFSLIPLGGYVKMFSDLNPASQPDMESIQAMSEEDKARSLFHKTVGQRIAVSAAGPLANYLFAIVLLGGLYMTVGQRVPSETATLGFVMPKSAAAEAGLQKGDRLIEMGGVTIATFDEMQQQARANPGKELPLTILRDGQEVHVKITPKSVMVRGTEIGKLGVSQGVAEVKRSPATAFFYAAADCVTISWKTVKSLGQVIVGKESSEGLSGPLGIAALTSEVAQRGLVDLLWLAAFLSINLGLINLFPVPMLDGGHLLFYGIEAVRGKPVSDQTQEIGYRIGFALVMALVLFSTWNDLSRLKVFEFFAKFFK